MEVWAKFQNLTLKGKTFHQSQNSLAQNITTDYNIKIDVITDKQDLMSTAAIDSIYSNKLALLFAVFV